MIDELLGNCSSLGHWIFLRYTFCLHIWASLSYNLGTATDEEDANAHTVICAAYTTFGEIQNTNSFALSPQANYTD
jgi:hypothetical protein